MLGVQDDGVTVAELKRFPPRHLKSVDAIGLELGGLGLQPKVAHTCALAGSVQDHVTR